MFLMVGVFLFDVVFAKKLYLKNFFNNKINNKHLPLIVLKFEFLKLFDPLMRLQLKVFELKN